jgi:serine/threonine-protein kinase RsbW
MAAGTSVKLVIPSEIRLVDLVHAASEKMAELAGFDADEALNVGLAVREAVINAMLHGNEQDPSRQVHVTLTKRADALLASVRDEGNGFDRQTTPDPTDGTNRMRTSGRGLLLMEAFVDEVRFDHPPEGGTEVTMTKRLPSPVQSEGD